MLAQFFNPRQNYSRGFMISVFSVFIVCFSSPAFAQQSKSTLSARLMNIESATKDPFRYNVSLHNGSSRPQVFELQAKAPEGWIMIFRAEGSQVTALRLDSGKTQDMVVETTATPATKPGKYSIPVSAISGGDTLRLDLEAVVKGSYSVELTTPTGRLSDDITEGNTEQLRLTIINTGSLPLDGLELSAQSPTKWSAKFDPAKIERLDPGQTKEVIATVSVPDKTIAGDYMTTFTAKNSFANANAAFRMTVKTSLLSGWIGIVVILIALGLVYSLIRKYGRR
ncbi:MAG TPA: NEW3 domain-containing protein [Agriterribacter sp.]|nr:NEW3 domain-containing protein [Agriterribacter sp.]